MSLLLLNRNRIHDIKKVGKIWKRNILLPSSSIQIRQYNFASTEYKSCFGGLPIADGVKLREDTIAYLDRCRGDISWGGG